MRRMMAAGIVMASLTGCAGASSTTVTVSSPARTVTVRSRSAASSHARTRAARATAAATRCDPNISVSGGSCGLAENTFYAYWASQGASSFTAADYSGVSHHLSCAGSITIVCASSDGARITFSQAAVAAYTPSEAAAYAAAHGLPAPGSTPGNPSTSTRASASTGTAEGPGSYSHAGDAAFCSTHACIANFPNGNGYVVQCTDGTWSHSGGLSGACSDHGGES